LSPVSAQPPKTPAQPTPTAPAAGRPPTKAPAPKATPPKGKEDPKLKPRWESMKTKDGLSIRAYYAPSDKGKDAIPVLVIHEWQGQGSPYGTLVTALHNAGCAVIVPEYRGHGTSRTYVDVGGQEKEFNLKTMNAKDINDIMNIDIEEVKQFLKKENNEERLNLNALVVVGVREGAIMAAHWTVRDWSFPSVGRIKQGQDVKGLVLVSPEKNFKGMAIDPTLKNPAIMQMPMMIIAGAESEDADEAKRLGKQVESTKKRISRGGATQGFALELTPTSLRGPQLVAQTPTVIPQIVKFIAANIKVSDEENPWVKRE
jgi:pimeloyl-ACP methyl ester carboxylesterase